MTELSPAAQAVAWAYDNTPEKESGNHRYHWIAAALRAAAELESIKPEALGPCDERYGPTDNQVTLSEQGYNYQLALAVKRTQVGIYRALRAIADELEGQ